MRLLRTALLSIVGAAGAWACDLATGGLPGDAGGAPDGPGCPPSAPTPCSDRCVDTTNDFRNCGACNNDCTLGGTKPVAGCVNGSCADCGPKIDLSVDPNHCGRCGHSCRGAGCAGGRCAKELLAALSSPLALALDGKTLYCSAKDKIVYRLGVTPDAGAPEPLSGPLAAPTVGLAPLPGAVAAAYIQGSSILAPDAAPVWVEDYLGVYGITSRSGRFWWATQYEAKVKTLEDGAAAVLATDAPGARSLAVDSQWLYWLNLGTSKVMRSPVDGGPPTLLASFLVPRATDHSMQLIRTANELVWTVPSTTDVASDGLVLRLAGAMPGAPTPLATNQANPQYVAFDGTDVFWTNLGNGTIVAVRADGTETMTRDVAVGLSSPVGIAVDVDYVYFVESTLTGGVYRIAK